MYLEFVKAKAFSKIFEKISKHVISTDVSIDTSNCYDTTVQKYVSRTSFRYINPIFPDINSMVGFSKFSPIPKKFKVADTAVNDEIQGILSSALSFGSSATVQKLSASTAKGHRTIRLITNRTPESLIPWIVEKAPVEYTSGDYTYRLITGENKKSYEPEIKLIAESNEPIYDYLDRGYLLMCLTENVPNLSEAKEDFLERLDAHKWVVSNVYDLNTAHIFMMCRLQPCLTDLLQDGCFINRDEAEMLRLKMFKKLTPEAKVNYTKFSSVLDEDYKQNSTMVVVNKLINREIPKTTIRDIAFSTIHAKYENVSIQADNLLDVLEKKLDFNGEFDIYTVVELYALHVKGNADTAAWTVDEINRINAGNTELKNKKIADLKINDIDISVDLNYSGQRFINDIRINKDEVAKALQRASCYRSAEEYNLFLKSISRMSIRWHDIIANGLQVKIQDNISREDLRNPLPSINAPALKFFVDNQGYINLQVTQERGVRVNLSALIKKVEVINKKTDGRGVRDLLGHFVYRTNTWSSRRLIEALIETTTFKEKVRQEDGTIKEVERVLINEDDVTKLLAVVGAQSKAKIERSKKFLETAVQLTNAELIHFRGESAYKVQGALRTYAVVISTAKVYDYDTKQYRCIVNGSHYKGAGYDDVASRLLALKNDSVMVDSIRTLSGAAQPGAENAHHYIPEREHNSEDVSESIKKAFEAKLNESLQ